MKAVRILLSTLGVCAIIPFFVNAAAPINYLNVENDIVYFSTSESKNKASPNCAVDETKEQWAMSLTSTEGRNLYRALLTANASGNSIEVTSANDCQATQNIERPLSIEIVLL